MDIRTKLVFALVATALVSMLALGAVGYAKARELVRINSLRQLDALAESRQRDLEAVIAGWGERVGLVGSRTQLRLTLGRYGEDDPGRARALLERILDDAREAASSVLSLGLYDDRRRLVAASRAAGQPEPVGILPDSVARAFAEGPPGFFELDVDADGATAARYLMPLQAEEGGRVGWLSALLEADDLTQLAADTTGLGTTGETLIVTDRDGELRVLHPTRHARPADPVARAGVDPARLAAAGRDTILWRDAVDYRGRSVWAATRYVPGLDWGIVVKVDVEEERGPLLRLRDEMARLALSLAAFAILAGVLLGLHLARPIHDLAEVANRIRAGETHVRATVHHEDEVGMLARTFNRMADTLTRGRLSIADEADDGEREDGAA